MYVGLFLAGWLIGLVYGFLVGRLYDVRHNQPYRES